MLPESQRTVVNGVDIDRLHYVLENRPLVNRGAGKTFARIHEMIGELHFGCKDLLIVMSTWKDINYLQRMIRSQLHLAGIPFDYNVDQFLFYGPHYVIKMTTEEYLEEDSRGWKPTVIYMRHED